MSSMGRRYTIKELPPELRPREGLLSEGAEALSSAELLGAVRKNVIRRIENVVGLRVTEVNITVNDVYFSQQEQQQQQG